MTVHSPTPVDVGPAERESATVRIAALAEWLS